VQVIVELNLFLVGWITYYRYAACRFEVQCLDEWIRRKLRCYRLKQCKRGKAVAGFLQHLGASPSLARRLASSGKGWWRLSLGRPVHQAMSRNGSLHRDSYLCSASMMRYDIEETAVYDKYVRWCGRTGP
jgi:hypothetical protein